MLGKLIEWFGILCCSHCYHAEKVERFEVEIKSRCKQRSPYILHKWRIFKYCCLCSGKKQVVKDAGKLTRGEKMVYYGESYKDSNDFV